jgi:hypothetical protein
MVSYEVDGSILTFRASGTITREQRPGIRRGARRCAGPKCRAGSARRARVDVGVITPVVVTPKLADQASIFQTEATGFGLRVKLFGDERFARLWLNANKSGHCDER